MKPGFSKALATGLPLLLFACAGIVFYRSCTVEGGGDFRVYWNVARRVLEGGPVYQPSTDVPMGFKYPPWSLVPFLPLGLLSFEAARAIWAALNVAAMYACFLWTLRKLGCSLASIAVVLVADWGIWMSQFNNGQIGLAALVGMLWFWSPDLPMAGRSPLRTIGLLFSSSTKITTAYALLYFQRARDWLKPRVLLVSVIGLAALSLPAFFSFSSPRLTNLVVSWQEIASSAVRGFGPLFARGRQNQGLPVLLGRATGFESLSDLPELVGVIVFGLLLAWFWSRAGRGLKDAECWAGWVALTCLVSPLSWQHGFVMALPFLSLCLQAAWDSRRKDALALVAFGLVCTGLVTYNTAIHVGRFLGVGEALIPVSNFIEHLSIKSWGVLLCAAGLLLVRQPGRRSTLAETPRAPAVPGRPGNRYGQCAPCPPHDGSRSRRS